VHCDAIKDWVEVHPEIKSKFEELIRNVPEANRERAFINVAKTEAMRCTACLKVKGGWSVEPAKRRAPRRGAMCVTSIIGGQFFCAALNSRWSSTEKRGSDTPNRFWAT
jgi:hypothetical protein